MLGTTTLLPCIKSLRILGYLVVAILEVYTTQIEKLGLVGRIYTLMSCSIPGVVPCHGNKRTTRGLQGVRFRQECFRRSPRSRITKLAVANALEISCVL